MFDKMIEAAVRLFNKILGGKKIIRIFKSENHANGAAILVFVDDKGEIDVWMQEGLTSARAREIFKELHERGVWEDGEEPR
jgi:hypothetical protein